MARLSCSFSEHHDFAVPAKEVHVLAASSANLNSVGALNSWVACMDVRNSSNESNPFGGRLGGLTCTT
eukprot:CAMPEP_0203945086 /NCGR_PEP_ID=MMETSP0359-20131031/80691_1 /ASSEMBLY_ACC=CAM_ASM_000338 /TAXON_ID=268821 /ORGANISM="Scrippsiella Hangoei, Strain SHTV-5" /LENGTH=67 /DNA_ID=CAMNT_0050876199 /DNA_START=65 /DNA_END=264 /DNA_ORIENTATION=-